MSATFELSAQPGQSRRAGHGVEQGMGARTVALDREISGVFDLGAGSAENKCHESGSGQLDRGVRLTVRSGVDHSVSNFDAKPFIFHSNFVAAICLAR
jgi:hypothetical protein